MITHRPKPCLFSNRTAPLWGLALAGLVLAFANTGCRTASAAAGPAQAPVVTPTLETAPPAELETIIAASPPSAADRVAAADGSLFIDVIDRTPEGETPVRRTRFQVALPGAGRDSSELVARVGARGEVVRYKLRVHRPGGPEYTGDVVFVQLERSVTGHPKTTGLRVEGSAAPARMAKGERTVLGRVGRPDGGETIVVLRPAPRSPADSHIAAASPDPAFASDASAVVTSGP